MTAIARLRFWIWRHLATWANRRMMAANYDYQARQTAADFRRWQAKWQAAHPKRREA